MSILVAGIGNIFLSDDGFGPEVVRRLTSSGPTLPDTVRVVDYGIRGMHLAYDLLDGYDALVLVDAMPGSGSPGQVSILSVDADDVARGGRGLDAHGMDPLAVLSSLTALGGALPPTFVVGAQAADVSEGIGLTEVMAAAVPHAVDAVRALVQDQLCATPDLAGRSE